MKLKKLNFQIRARHFEKMIQENSPLILTALGVAGTIGTAILVGKASFKASETLNDVSDEEGYIKLENRTPLTNKDKALLVWKLYLPALGVGSATIACIVMSHRISTRRLAAMTGAFALLSKDFDEYRDKVYETVGLKKADEVNASQAKGRFAKNPPTAPLDGSKSWFEDMSSGRRFLSTMETVKAAQNDLNYMLNQQSDCTLNDFWEHLGLFPTAIGDLLGWDSGDKLELVFTPILMDEGGAATAFRFAKNPRPKGR